MYVVEMYFCHNNVGNCWKFRQNYEVLSKCNEKWLSEWISEEDKNTLHWSANGVRSQ